MASFWIRYDQLTESICTEMGWKCSDRTYGTCIIMIKYIGLPQPIGNAVLNYKGNR